MDVIRAIRSRRAELNVPPSKKAAVMVVTKRSEEFAAGAGYLPRLMCASSIDVRGEEPDDVTGLVCDVTHDAKIYMPLAELVDIAEELQRIAKEREKAEKGLAIIEKKLSNEAFVAKAPEAVVSAEREKAEKLRALIAKLNESAAAMQS